MEEIIISLLFLYPGALIEMLYDRYAKYSYRRTDTDSKAKVAEYFLNSVIVTIITILVYRCLAKQDVHTFKELVQVLSSFGEALLYFVLSLAFTGIYAFVRYHIMGMAPRLAGSSVLSEKVNGLEEIGSVNSWRDIIFGPQSKDVLQHCILRIQVGDQVVAGFAECLPVDFERGITLTQTVFVQELLEKEKDKPLDERFIGNPYFTYFDSPTGTRVEFFDGSELFSYLEE